MSSFNIAIAKLLSAEGGFVPIDVHNGAANFGITEWFARNILKVGDAKNFVKSLTKDDAENIYYAKFWRAYRVGEINNNRVATMVLFAVVNMNPSTAIKTFQASVNDLGVAYPPLAEDGVLGPKTIARVNTLGAVDLEELLNCFAVRLRAFYHHLAAKDPETYQPHLAGWLRRVDESMQA